MRTRVAHVLLLATALSLPHALSGQIGIGAHVGTTGFGGDVALALGGSAQLRGTVGIMPIEPDFTISDIDVTVELPKTFMTAGIDFFPGGSGFRIGGGVMIKPDDPSLSGEFAGSVDIGGQQYTGAQVGTLTGLVESKKISPYAMIGFGKHASSGIGLFLDLGAAFVGESTLTLDADGPISNDAQFQQRLETERQDWQETIDKYKIYPIINVGLRVGIGG